MSIICNLKNESFSPSSNKQNKTWVKKKDCYYDTLVFSGGDVKGFCFLSVVKYLEENKNIQNIKRYVGSSVRGKYATLLCIWFTYDDM